MPNTEWLIPDIKTTQDLSAAVLNFTTSIGRPFKLGKIIINFNDGASPPVAVAVTETITITLISAKGAIYNTILRKKSLSAESNFVYTAPSDSDYQSGDEIKIQCTDAGGVGITNVIVKAKELHK